MWGGIIAKPKKKGKKGKFQILHSLKWPLLWPLYNEMLTNQPILLFIISATEFLTLR